MVSVKQARLDLAHYGFVPDRRRALAERFPSYAAVKSEAPSHPDQRDRAAEWVATMSDPAGREMATVAASVDHVTRWQEAEADRFIAEMEAKRRSWRHTVRPPRAGVDYSQIPDDADEADLIHAAVAQLKARYGGPSTFKETA